MKLCRDCKWYVANRADASLSKVECANSKNQYPDYITGAIKHQYLTAQALRVDSQFCGPEAKWFESEEILDNPYAREKHDQFKFTGKA